MDGVTAIVTVITSTLATFGTLAWPIAAFGIAWLFRGEIRSLVQRAEKAAFPGVELTFSSGLREVAALAQQTVTQDSDKRTDLVDESLNPGPSDDALCADVTETDSYCAPVVGLRTLAPAERVTNEWNRVYWHVQTLYVQTFGVESELPRVMSLVFGHLGAKRVLTPDQVALANKLYDLRNFAIANPLEVTALEADAYEAYAEGLRATLISRLA